MSFLHSPTGSKLDTSQSAFFKSRTRCNLYGTGRGILADLRKDLQASFDQVCSSSDVPVKH
jgi:hypothetical protein